MKSFSHRDSRARRGLIAALIAAAIGVLLGCSVAAPASPREHPPGTTTGATPATTTGSTTTPTTVSTIPSMCRTQAAAGRQSAIICRPPGLSSSTKIPLLIALEGSGGTPSGMMTGTGFNSLATKYGFEVAYLGSVDAVHNWWTAYDPNYLSYFSSMISQLEGTDNIDPTRIYFAGFSAGGLASYRAACELGGKVAAFADLGAVVGPHRCFSLPAPVSQLTILGTQDRYPVSGTVTSGTATATRFTGLDGCTAQSSTTQVGPTSQHIWSNCNAGTTVGLYVIQGGGHVWPQPQPTPPYAPTGSPDAQYYASLAIWQFLSPHRLDRISGDFGLSSMHVKRHKHTRTLITTFRLSEGVRVKAVLGNGHRRLAVKTFSLSRGNQVQYNLTVPRKAKAGRYRLTFAVTDAYGRSLTLAQAFKLPGA